MLTAKEIRRRFLAFFKAHGHTLVPSTPLIPPNDPTLLFTNAGMVQFKKLFLGEEKREYSRAVSCQKCLRVSGKHNDLENVGRTARHHTFFEMLGNFSFGDYFKREAIALAWEFVTGELGLPVRDLYVTVFRDDNETVALWREIASLPDARIVRMGEKDNFWTMGDTGPCGPCSEIYIDQGADMACGPDCGIGKCDCDRFLEIWNLVFTQFDQFSDGTRAPLAAPNIDTGMGLERIAAVCQGKRSNFDCDLFQEIIQHAAALARVTYSFSAPDTNDMDTALRVIADHSRAAAFLIADGVLPSNENRGYVLRRLIRRALRFATLININEPFLYKTARKTADTMARDYPELAASAKFISRAVFEEEQRFSLTLEKGLHLLDEELQHLEKRGKTEISGDFCFKLYDTYGFPLDIVTDVAGKRGFTANAADFEKNMLEQRMRARASRKKTLRDKQEGAHHLEKDCLRSVKDAEGLCSLRTWGGGGTTPRPIFVGYENLTVQSRIVALLDANGQPVERLKQGEHGFVVTGKTPFYGESGGQAGDCGLLESATGQAEVTTTLKPDIIIPSISVNQGCLLLDQEVVLRVDSTARAGTARNHTATHLLHAALRRTLGTHVRQAGSLVDSRRLRFDFSHITALTQEELAAVEKDVNRAVFADFPVIAKEMPREEALALGATALFDEKYGSSVRAVRVGQPENSAESLELCGGTHVCRTGEIGVFLIVSESGVAAGTRRIEALTGWNAYSLALEQRTELSALSTLLKTRSGQLAERVQLMQSDIKKLRKAAEKTSSVTTDPLRDLEEIRGIRVLTMQIPSLSVQALREHMDTVRSRLTSSTVACLAAVEEGKVTLLLYVSKDLHSSFTAPALIREVAAVCGGGGGGRPDLAQAGGTLPDGLPKAFALLKSLIADTPK
ncbi:MAG: alanine--tRNA ligase [Desulfovibrio sp.]|jgi:alanyl-tRNA synthetase|nr:alanine--tRNA ligase [Desulfovibrio sp.]